MKVSRKRRRSPPVIRENIKTLIIADRGRRREKG
jgi:hypothetical protein